jgi:hypothetical protein
MTFHFKKIFTFAFILLSIFSCNRGSYFKDNVIETKETDLEVFTGDSLTTTWKFTVKNKLNRNYNLPKENAAAYLVRSNGKGLSQEYYIKWPEGIYLPPNELVSLPFSIKFVYTESFPKDQKDDLDKLGAFMDKRNSEIDGFLIIDNKNRIKIFFKNDYQDTTKKKMPKPLASKSSLRNGAVQWSANWLISCSERTQTRAVFRIKISGG